jgi:hypothetical protein
MASNIDGEIDGKRVYAKKNQESKKKKLEWVTPV